MKATDSDIAKLVDSFDQYAKTGDKSLIQTFSQDLLEHTLIRNSNCKGRPYYVAIESRVQELREQAAKLNSQHERRKDIIIGIIVGVIVTLLSQWLWFLITGSK